jgi:hypothetical protein
MRQRFRTYTAYSIGTAIVWGVVLLVAWLIDSSSTLRAFWLVSLGFFLGWLSATIARVVYPPPKKYWSRLAQAAQSDAD